MHSLVPSTRIYSGCTEASKEKLDPSGVKVQMTGTSAAKDDAWSRKTRIKMLWFPPGFLPCIHSPAGGFYECGCLWLFTWLWPTQPMMVTCRSHPHGWIVSIASECAHLLILHARRTLGLTGAREALWGYRKRWLLQIITQAFLMKRTMPL